MIKNNLNKLDKPLRFGLIADRSLLSKNQKVISKVERSGWVLLTSVSGKGIIRLPSSKITVKVGDIILYQPKVPIDWRVDEQSDHWEFLWAYFVPKSEWVYWLYWPEISPGIFEINAQESENWPIILKAINKTLKYCNSNKHNGVQLGFNALEELILQCDLINPLVRLNLFDSRVKIAIAFIVEHLGDDLHMKDIAGVCHLSISRLRHLFLEYTGISVHKFIEDRRIERARDRLRLTTEPINQIAYSLGFKSPFYFSNRFKLHTGVSPRYFRDHQQGENFESSRHWKPQACCIETVN